MPTPLRLLSRAAAFFFFCYVASGQSGAPPIRLHAQNPHYFEFRGKPAVLVTSGEHYGSALNLDFDYKTYLDVLSSHGFNLTRLFMGNYYEPRSGGEPPTDPLSPRLGRFLTPWARSSTPGFAGGGNKFDLDRWDPAYFDRLKDFCREASRRGIVVEVVMFTALYRPEYWRVSPLNAESNVNNTPVLPLTEFHTLKHPALVDRQKAMVRKVVTELRDFDNVYFEICNEPYWAKGIPEVDPSIKSQNWPPDMMEWQKAIAAAIVEAEGGQSARHLIAMNIANTYYKVEQAEPAVSILNFHYAYPPRAVADNYHWNRVIAFDETSNGCAAPDRRREAWAFLMAGGAVYSNLDFSFTMDDPTGRGRAPKGRRQSCWEARVQLGALLQFVNRLDFIHMQPMAGSEFGPLPERVRAWGLKNPGAEYAAYFVKEDFTDVQTLSLDLPGGNYAVEWVDPLDGRVLSTAQKSHSGGPLSLTPPQFRDDLALVIRKR